MSTARERLMRIAARIVKERGKPLDKRAEQAKTMKRWNVVRGDLVQVIGNHPSRGMQGTVKEVIRKKLEVIVEGVNKKKITVRGNPEKGIKGRIVERERPIPYESVSLIDPVKKVPTRIVYQKQEDGTKLRISKKSGAVIPRPEILLHRRRPVRFTVTESDTLEDDVWEQTYDPSCKGREPMVMPEGLLELEHLKLRIKSQDDE